MYTFAIRQAYGSDKLLIEFYPEPSDRGFQEALCMALTPAGFSVTTTEHGVWASHPDPESSLGAVHVDSDSWCTFGEADQWSSNAVRNRQLISELGALLVGSGVFQEVSWHGANRAGA